MKNLVKFNLLLTLVAFAILPVCTKAQENVKKEKDMAKSEMKVTDNNDAKMLEEAYSCGMKEIKMAESVKSRVISEDVKKLTETIIASHYTMNMKLKELAASKNISLPSQLTKAQQEEIDRLSKKSGDDLDNEYIDMLVMSHKKSADLYEKGSKANDEQIRGYFAESLPTINEHLDMVRSLDDKVDKHDQGQKHSDMTN